MDWSAISAVTDIVGAILLVASLVYVARQLGQNNAMMRVAAAGQRLERVDDIVLPIIENPELAALWLRGGTEFDSLDQASQLRLLFFERRALSLWHHMYQLRMQQLLPDANWHETIWVIQHLGRRQAVREAWQRYRGSFQPPFQEFVEGQFGRGDQLEAGS